MIGESRIYSRDWCSTHRASSSGLISLLAGREMGRKGGREGNHFIKGGREIYHMVPIRRSQHICNRPQFHPMRFTPDGNKLIGFGAYLQEVLIYRYAGVQTIAGKHIKEEQLFERLFPSSFRVNFWNVNGSNGMQTDRFTFGQLSKECCLVTPDSRHLVVCSHLAISENSSLLNEGIMRNNESLPLGSAGIEDVTLHCIDLEKGIAVDSVRLSFELIYPAQGIYLLGRTLAVLSVQHQTIHIFQIDTKSGKLTKRMEIGRRAEDVSMDEQSHSPEKPGSPMVSEETVRKTTVSPSEEKWLTGFRQRLLTFLYKLHASKGRSVEFLRNMGFYRSLKMHKIQLVEPDLLVIKMDTNAIQQEPPHPSNYLFVLLRWTDVRIVGVYERNSLKLLRILERYNAMFRCTSINPHFPSSLEHCSRLRSSYEHTKSGLLASSPITEVSRRLLTYLPYPASGVPVNVPYLDPQMFSIDEKVLLHMERGKLPPQEQPIRIFSRRTRHLHAELRFQDSELSPAYTSRVIFHPYDPFAMSCNLRSQPDSLAIFHSP